MLFLQFVSCMRAGVCSLLNEVLALLMRLSPQQLVRSLSQSSVNQGFVYPRPSPADPGSDGLVWVSGFDSEDVSPLQRTDYSSYLRTGSHSENQTRVTRPHTAMRRARWSRLSVFLLFSERPSEISQALSFVRGPPRTRCAPPRPPSPVDCLLELDSRCVGSSAPLYRHTGAFVAGETRRTY